MNAVNRNTNITPDGTYVEAFDLKNMYINEGSQCKKAVGIYGQPLQNDLLKNIDETKCLKMILNPEFVDNLTVLKQISGSTIAASTQSDGEI